MHKEPPKSQRLYSRAQSGIDTIKIVVGSPDGDVSVVYIEAMVETYAA